MSPTGSFAPAVSQTEEKPLILLVKDEERNVYMLLNYLKSKDYRVFVARNGMEAIEQTRRLRPDLILMDIQMPEMDGLEAIRHIRQGGETVPIIALTALAVPGDRERCLTVGADDYLSKPVRLKALTELIETHVRS